jgi:hypothetical protein
VRAWRNADAGGGSKAGNVPDAAGPITVDTPIDAPAHQHQPLVFGLRSARKPAHLDPEGRPVVPHVLALRPGMIRALERLRGSRRDQSVGSSPSAGKITSRNSSAMRR